MSYKYVSKSQYLQIRKVFLGNLNEPIALVELDITFKVLSFSANEIASLKFKLLDFYKTFSLRGN